VADPGELQRRYAIARAQQMRLHRAWLLTEVAAGDLSIDALLDDVTMGEWCATVKVVVVAEKVPGVGKVRARRAMEQLGVAEGARWGEVDPATLRRLWSTMAEAAARPL
jgi:hypothetical protein